jgi:hypothetical protein
MSHDFSFRIRFYNDGERTDLEHTYYSGNDTTGWTVNGSSIPASGFSIDPGEDVSVLFEPSSNSIETRTVYYLSIDSFDGAEFTNSSNSYTFMANDEDSLVYCGPYVGVPVVKNFGMMFELVNNELLKLNLNV